MIDLKKYQIIDLSQELIPGIHKVNGEYTHGTGEPPYGNRRLELRQFMDKSGGQFYFMHWIETETHIGTHVEAPSHLIINGKEGGKSASEFLPNKWIGEAIVLNFSHKKPINGKGQPITLKELEKVKDGDIVLMWSGFPEGSKEAPYLSDEAVDYLIKKKIKLAGLTGIGLGSCHDPFIKKEIPIVEGLSNLKEIRKERVFYIGLPLRWYGLDACPIRAIVLEEK